MFSKFTIIRPDTSLISFDNFSLSQILNFLSQPIILLNDIQAIKDKLKKYQDENTFSDEDHINLTLINQVLSDIDYAKLNNNDVKIDYLKKLYAQHPANITQADSHNFFINDVIKKIFSYFSNQELSNLMQVSKQFRDITDSMPISEKYIFPKKINGVISTLFNNIQNTTYTHYTRRQLKQALGILENASKDLYLKRSEAHTFINLENERNSKKRVLLDMLLLFPMLILACTPTILGAAWRDEHGQGNKFYQNLGLAISITIFFAYFLYLLNEIFGAPSQAKREVQKNAYSFFHSVSTSEKSDSGILTNNLNGNL